MLNVQCPTVPSPIPTPPSPSLTTIGFLYPSILTPSPLALHWLEPQSRLHTHTNTHPRSQGGGYVNIDKGSAVIIDVLEIVGLFCHCTAVQCGQLLFAVRMLHLQVFPSGFHIVQPRE